MAAAMNCCVRPKVIQLNGILKHQAQGLALTSRKTVRSCQKCYCPAPFLYSSSVISYARQFSSAKPTADRDDISQSRVNDEHNKDSDGQKDKDDNSGWAKYKNYVLAGCGFMFLGSATQLIMHWGAPEFDEKGLPIEDEFSHHFGPIGYCMRTYKEVFFQVKVTKEPSRQKLLPEPLSYPYIQPPYTLVIEMTDVLVHPEWTYGTGWRFKKRPGIDHFLRVVGPPTFEVVIFTKESGMTADPIIAKIDPDNFVMYRLYRDATRYEDGLHVKDLNYLNRDLSKVIMIDWDKDAYKLNPENGFQLKRWTGEKQDLVLGELAEFLSALAASNVEDVRPVLQYYSQFDDPIAQFHENQLKLREEQERQAQKVQQRSQKNLASGFLNKLKL